MTNKKNIIITTISFIIIATLFLACSEDNIAEVNSNLTISTVQPLHGI